MHKHARGAGGVVLQGHIYSLYTVPTPRSCRSEACVEAFILIICTRGAAVTVNWLLMHIISPSQDSRPWWSGEHLELCGGQQAHFLCFFSFSSPTAPPPVSAFVLHILYCLWANSQVQNPCQGAVCTVQPLLPSWSQVTSTSCSWEGFKELKVKGRCAWWGVQEENVKIILIHPYVGTATNPISDCYCGLF